jgi:mono/diheme cytochrome c family protein
MTKGILLVAALLVVVACFIGGVFLSTYRLSSEEPATNSGSLAPAPATPTPPVNSSAPSPAGLASADLARAERLFKANCASCHTASGKGEAHHRKDNIPDFTDEAWHARRSDAKLVASIENGKGAVMPSFKGKLSPAEIRLLVGYIPGFPDRAAHGGVAGQNAPARGGHHH